MKRYIHILTTLCLTLTAVTVTAKPSAEPANAKQFYYGESDAVAKAEIRHRVDSIKRHRPVVALVLSGGGAKGAAHIGVIDYIESLGIPVDMVLGTSMGGLIGGLYSMGYTAPEMDSLIRTIDWSWAMSDKVSRKYISYDNMMYNEKFVVRIPFYYPKSKLKKSADLNFSDGTTRLHLGAEHQNMTDVLTNNFLGSLPSGYVKGQNVHKLISGLSVGYQDSLAFSRLPIPFVCVASDMVSGEGIYWYSGSLPMALRSTMSIPGVFAPVKMDGMVLVDGGLRDNFPTKEARALGADIIIGVVLSDEYKTYEQINNIGDIISQGIDMLGRAVYEENTKEPDVLIRPRTKGYGMMSFDAASIDTLIRRGREGAMAKHEQLAEVKRRVGDSVTKRYGGHAVDINTKPVRIDGFEIRGASERALPILKEHIDIAPGDVVSREDVEDAVSRIYGTKAYEYVSYEFEGTEEPYHLVINCKRGPIHRFGVGLRLDTEEVVAVMLNLGLSSYQPYGSTFDFTAKIGANPYLSAHYSYDIAKVPTINVAASAKWTNLDMLNFLGLDTYHMHMRYFITTQEFFFSERAWHMFDLKGGLRNKYFKIRSISNEVTSPVYIEDLDYSMYDNDYLSLFIDGNINTFDNGYFPHKGLSAHVSYEWVFNAYPNRWKNIHLAAASVSGVVEKGRFAFLPSASMRFIFNGSPLAYDNYMGGDFSGRYFDQQMAFIGKNNVAPMGDILALLRADFRVEVAHNHYLTAMLNYARDSGSLADYFTCNAGNWYGAGIQYAYNAFFGPIKCNLHWSNIDMSHNGGFGFYIGVGYDF